MTDYKEHSAIFLSNRLRGSSDWRRAQGTQFPADTRNDKASQRWLELKSLIEISDTVWTAIAAYYNESDSRWLAAVSDTNRDIGFRWHPRDFAAQSVLIIALATVIALVAVYSLFALRRK